jgi:hypothetical protein
MVGPFLSKENHASLSSRSPLVTSLKICPKSHYAVEKAGVVA